MGWEEKIEQGISQGSAGEGSILNVFAVGKPITGFKGVGFGIKLGEWESKSNWLRDSGHIC